MRILASPTNYISTSNTLPTSRRQYASRSEKSWEHQTINAYGYEFKRGPYGFDWLFHHELAHEWFGNVMTHETVSDMCEKLLANTVIENYDIDIVA